MLISILYSWSFLILCMFAYAAPDIAYRDNSRPQGITVPLTIGRQGRKTPEETAAWARRHGQHLITKYRARNRATIKQKRDTGSNDLVNHNQDSSYFGSLAIGTPAEAFNVILDTGSADLWIASSTCTRGCPGIPTYDAKRSSTFKNLTQPFSITYGSGAASGFLAQDTVQMAGFSVPGQTFAVVDRVSSNLLTNPVSGLLGLGFQTISTSKALPLWQAMVESGVWTEPVFAFYLTRFINASHAETQEPGGRLTLGFADPTFHVGEIEYTDIPTGASGYWIIPLTGLAVNGDPINIGSTAQSSFSAIDTGTTLIGGPSAVIKEIFSTIPGSSPATGDYEGYYTYPCSTAVQISLSFGGGTAWTIDPQDFTLAQLQDPDLCLGAFFSLDMGPTGPAWIIGDTFLKNVYSVFRFNPPSVGFASLSLSALQLAVAGGPLPSQTIGDHPAIATAGSTSSSPSAYNGCFTTGLWAIVAILLYHLV